MQPTAAIPPAIAAVFASPPLRGDPDRATLDCDGGRRLRLLLDQAQPGESSSVASSSLTTWRSPEPRPETAPGARRARRLVSKLAAPPVGVVRTDMHNHTNERAKRLDHTFSHLASLGNFDVRADLSVSGTALWQCPNEDANTAPRQNKVLIGAPTSSTSFRHARSRTATSRLQRTRPSGRGTVLGRRRVVRTQLVRGNPALTVTSITLVISQPPGNVIFTCSAGDPLSGTVALSCCDSRGTHVPPSSAFWCLTAGEDAADAVRPLDENGGQIDRQALPALVA
jgi:hypothetical protein